MKNTTIFKLIGYIAFLFMVVFFSSLDVYAIGDLPIEGQDELFFSVDFENLSSELQSFSVGRTYPSEAEVAFKLIPTHSISLCSVNLWIRKVNNPTGSISFDLYSGGTGDSGILLASSDNTYDLNDLTTSYSSASFHFPSNICQGIAGGSTYWLLLKKSGSPSLSDYFQVAGWYYTGGSPYEIYPTFYPDSSIKTTIWTNTDGVYAEANYFVNGLEVYGFDNLDISSFTPSSDSNVSGWDLTGADEFCNNAFPTQAASESWNPLTWFPDLNISLNLCLVGGYLFIPSPDVFANNSDVKEALFNKFPFNWVDSLHEVYSEDLDSSRVATTSYAVLTFENVHFQTFEASTSWDISLLKTASMSSFVPSSTIDLTRNLFMWIMFFSWGLGMLYLIIRWI